MSVRHPFFLNQQMKTKIIKAKLVLEDGEIFSGVSFGYEKSVAGEVVFNTAMTGYPESLTDPSYTGQILVTTYPLVGNYGVPEQINSNGVSMFFESDGIKVTAMVISDYSTEYSHWNARGSLGGWLKKHKIPGICGIDTRALTKRLRESGTMLGKIVIDDEEVDFYNPDLDNLVAKVSTAERAVFGNGRFKIILVDCGVKNNILRCLLNRDTTVIKVPWDYDFSGDEYDGIMLSNGPGDPKMCSTTILNIKKALQSSKPVFGICLGNQLLALAAGADTYKLKYGHRSHNQPVLKVGTNRCYITSQNHGFSIVPESLPADWEPLFVNVNDNTIEGIKHKEKPFFSVQFHPEASSGPTDTEYLFDEFIELISEKENV